jgi:predicted Zn-dependent protease
VSRRLQLALTVSAVAVAAAGSVVGVTLATRDNPPKLHPQPGKPPVPKSLERGARLQAQGHQHSAERLYLRAARLAPRDDEAQVAAAVGRFDKDDLAASFSKLGPLTRRFPRSQVVRFYLGLLSAWTGQRDEAVTQFEKTVVLGPKTQLGRAAQTFIERVGAGGTGRTKK